MITSVTSDIVGDCTVDEAYIAAVFCQLIHIASTETEAGSSHTYFAGGFHNEECFAVVSETWCHQKLQMHKTIIALLLIEPEQLDQHTA